MSSPWAFAGSWFPTVEFVQPAASIGDGTSCPLSWDATVGGTAASEICQFEWTTKTVRWIVIGSATVTFYDYTGGGGTPTSQTFAYSFNIVHTPTAGTTWDILEPTDLMFGGREFVNSTSVSLPASGLPWGPDNVTISTSFDVGSVTGMPLGAVDGTSFAKYAKSVELVISALTDSHPGSLSSSVIWGTNNSFVSGTATGVVANAFHGTAQFYSTQLNGASLTMSSGNLTVDDTFTQPPNI